MVNGTNSDSMRSGTKFCIWFSRKKKCLNRYCSFNGIRTSAHSYVLTLKPETSIQVLKSLKTFFAECLLRPSAIASKQSTKTPLLPSTQFSLKLSPSPNSSREISNHVFAFLENLSEFISIRHLLKNYLNNWFDLNNFPKIACTQKQGPDTIEYLFSLKN